MADVRLFATVVTAALVLLAPASAEGAAACWERVLADWMVDQTVDRSYPPSCYREAIAKLPEDLRTYSSAPEEIQRALQASIARRPAAVRVPLSRAAERGAATARDAAVGAAPQGRSSLRLILFALALVGVVAVAVTALGSAGRRLR
jgi:hypothetical protein